MDPRHARQGPSPGDSAAGDAGRSLREAPPLSRLVLRVVLALWVAALLLGSLGELFGITALVELTDYRAIFLR